MMNTETLAENQQGFFLVNPNKKVIPEYLI